MLYRVLQSEAENAVETRVERQISGRHEFENRHFHDVCYLVYINTCYKCYRFPLVLACYFEKLVSKCFAWYSVDRSYVGIWFALNRVLSFESLRSECATKKS